MCTPISAQIRQGDKVHFLGDSLSGGVVDWSAPLRTMISASVDEHGAPMSVTYTTLGNNGDTLGNITTNISTDLFAYDPNFLVFQIGVNDATAGETIATYVPRWRTFFNAALAWKPSLRILVLGAVWLGETWATGPVWDNVPADDANMLAVTTATNAVCNAYSVSYCDARGAALASMPANNPGKLSQGAETSDGKHPNATGKTVMCNAAYALLTFHS